MTFNLAKKKLDNLTEKDHDKLQVLLADLHKKISKNDTKTAKAIELASMALMLYTKGGKQDE